MPQCFNHFVKAVQFSLAIFEEGKWCHLRHLRQVGSW